MDDSAQTVETCFRQHNRYLIADVRTNPRRCTTNFRCNFDELTVPPRAAAEELPSSSVLPWMTAASEPYSYAGLYETWRDSEVLSAENPKGDHARSATALVYHHIPRSRCWCRRQQSDSTRITRTPCTPPPQICGDGVDGTWSTTRRPMISPPVHHFFPGSLQTRTVVRLAPSSYTTSCSRSASRSLHSCDDGAVLNKRTLPCRPLALTQRTAASQDPPFSMPHRTSAVDPLPRII